MASTHDSPAPVAALAGLSAATALSLTRVLAEHGWLAPVVAASVLPHVLVRFALRRRWSTLRATLVVGAAGILLAMWVVVPGATAAGIPTPHALAELARAANGGAETLRAASAPVPASGSALLLALGACWVLAATAAWLAQSQDSTLGAVVPPLVLFVVVAALGEGPWLWTTVVFAVAAGAFLLAQHEHLATPGRSWATARHRRRGRALAAGVVIGAAAVTAGAVVGPNLPGAESRGWMDYRDIGARGRSDLVLVSPLVDIRAQLTDPSPVPLFAVTADRPAYWRLIGLDRFDGRVWGLSGSSRPAREGLGARPPGRATRLQQTYELRGLDRHLLPAAYRPVVLCAKAPCLEPTADFGGASVVDDSSTLVAEGSTVGAAYTVVSEVPSPTAADLQAARRPPLGRMTTFTALPPDFPSQVRDTAVSVVSDAGAVTDFARLRALQDWFRSPANFTYDLNVSSGHADNDILHFLRVRRGYCEQFAGTFAAMARALGYPARVAVGFTPGTLDPASGKYEVTGREAHAWPEVYLDGAGWISFEPTPGRFEPSPNDHTGTGAQGPVARVGDDDTTSTTTAADDGASATTGAPRSLPPGADVSLGSPPPVSGDDRVAPWAVLAVVAAAALAAGIGLAGPRAVAQVRAVRLRRRRRRGGARARIHGAWDDAVDELARAGVPPRPTATPLEFALRHAAAGGAGAAGAPLVELARLETGARYAPEEPGDTDADTAWRHADRIATALGRRRLRARRGGSARAGRGPARRGSHASRRRPSRR
jgi:transglutaminase-like putative cysteine protease